MAVVLYTTLGCHLCEQAWEMVYTVNPTVTVEAVDVADDKSLLAAYGERIPVLRRGDRELVWPFGLLDVQQLLSP